MTPEPGAIDEAFRRLQRGDAAGALKLAAQLAARDPSAPRVHLAAGIALRALGELAASRATLEHAASLDPRDYAIAFELGATCRDLGDLEAAIAQFERASRLRPGFAPACFAAGLAHFARRDWPRAIAELERGIALDPGNADAIVNLALAWAEEGDTARALAAAERALELHPRHAAALHARGWILHKARRTAAAIESYEAALAQQPGVPEWMADLAKALLDLDRRDGAEALLQEATRIDPRQHPALRSMGQHCVARGDFPRAARMFAAAAAHDADPVELPMFRAQVELLLGRWREGWSLYASREHRRRFAAARAASGVPYQAPDRAALAGKNVVLVGEQGLGDTLFFLRFAPRLRNAGARLSFAGDARLHTLLARTGLFESLHADLASTDGDAIPLLAGDLPLVVHEEAMPCPPDLSIAALAERVAAWKRRLESAGPRPWIGITWRAGTPGEVLARGLYKAVPLEALVDAIAPQPGTIVAFQRGIREGEIAAASQQAGRPVADLCAMNDDLEDALAVVSLVDRHVAVSNTNVHLASAAGAASVDVLVPFPPEWRWGRSGASPWFPRFRVHRQSADGDWSAALAALRP